MGISAFIHECFCGATRKCTYIAIQVVMLVGCVHLLENLSHTKMLHQIPFASLTAWL